jgi:hypothetical protein
MPTLKARAYAALAASLASTNHAAVIDSKGYVTDVSQNFLSGVGPADVELALADLALGDGKDGEFKIKAAHSSAMLVLNAFAQWRAVPAGFPLMPGAESVQFERKLSMGLRGRMPNLDLVAESSGAVVAVESKCTEHLDLKGAAFSPAVVKRMGDLAHPTWRARLDEVIADPVQRHLDRAQLLKHYLGIKNCFPEKPATLLYVFWEPRNWAEFEECVEHRAEVAAFARGLADPLVRFRAMSYAELWVGWDTRHARALAERYLIDV